MGGEGIGNRAASAPFGGDGSAGTYALDNGDAPILEAVEGFAVVLGFRGLLGEAFATAGVGASRTGESWGDSKALMSIFTIHKELQGSREHWKVVVYRQYLDRLSSVRSRCFRWWADTVDRTARLFAPAARGPDIDQWT